MHDETPNSGKSVAPFEAGDAINPEADETPRSAAWRGAAAAPPGLRLDGRRDDALSLDARQDPVVIAVMRNERARLPGWLEHYRSIGMRRFVVVDNGSDDGAVEYLRGQDDVVLVHAEGRFSEANFGMAWVNAIRRQLAPAAWTLFADADEYLVYQGWPQRSLPEQLARLSGATAVLGFMLDMYPEGPVASVDPAGPLLQTCPFFDRDYVFRLRPKKPWDAQDPGLEIIGGPRVRLLSSMKKEVRTTWLDYFIRGQLDRVIGVTPAALLPPLIRLFPRSMPALKKTPLLRGADAFYINNHDAAGAVYAPRSCVSLHFKFTRDFVDTVRAAALMPEHYRRGAEYMMYRSATAKAGLVLYDAGASLRLTSAWDLLQAGLIRDLRGLLPSDRLS